MAYESEYETDEYEMDEYEMDEYEMDEYEMDEYEAGQSLGSFMGEMDSPLSEVEEMELATELLEISDEAELDQFLGKLFKKVARGVGGAIRGPIGRTLGGVLKKVAKSALPVVGGALGSFVAPGVGTALGSKLGSMASGLFEMELEAMDQEEAEFEVARRVVRLSADAAKTAATAPQSAPPKAVTKKAIVTAARKHAPGLVRGIAGAPCSNCGGTRLQPSYSAASVRYSGGANGGGAGGRWVRRGRKIVILGV
jgi:uncharacterized protein (DUF697 family)